MGIHSSTKHTLLNTYSILETVLGIEHIKMSQEVGSLLERKKEKVRWDRGKYVVGKKLMHIYKLRKEAEAMHVMNRV